VNAVKAGTLFQPLSSPCVVDMCYIT